MVYSTHPIKEFSFKGVQDTGFQELTYKRSVIDINDYHLKIDANKAVQSMLEVHNNRVKHINKSF